MFSGRVPERLNGQVSKTLGVIYGPREFKSPPFRTDHLFSMFGIKTRIKEIARERFGLFDDLTNIRINPVGYACNHACPMCWRLNLSPKEKQLYSAIDRTSLTLHEYETIFHDMPKTVRHVDVVGGGEPLLYRDIEALFRLIKTKRRTCRLITNGSLITESIAETLVNLSWDNVRISFHAASRSVYKKVNGADNFERVKRNFHILKKKRGSGRYPNIALLFVIQRDNYSDITRFVRLAQKLGVDEIQFDSLVPINKSLVLTPRQRATTVRLLRVSKKICTIRNNIAQAIDLYAHHPAWNEKKRSSSYFTGRYCELVQNNIDITSDGKVSPCCFAPMIRVGHSLRSHSIQEVWKDLRSFRTELRHGKFRTFCLAACNYDLPKRTA